MLNIISPRIHHYHQCYTQNKHITHSHQYYRTLDTNHKCYTLNHMPEYFDHLEPHMVTFLQTPHTLIWLTLITHTYHLSKMVHSLVWYIIITNETHILNLVQTYNKRCTHISQITHHTNPVWKPGLPRSPRTGMRHGAGHCHIHDDHHDHDDDHHHHLTTPAHNTVSNTKEEIIIVLLIISNT